MLPPEHVFPPRELLDNSLGDANPTSGPKWTGGDKILMQRAIANMPGVSAGDFRCYATLLFAIHDSKTGLCVASAERGSKKSGLSPRGWRASIRHLRELGIIGYVKNTGGRSQANYYILKSLHGVQGLSVEWGNRMPRNPSEKPEPIAGYRQQKPGKRSIKPGTDSRRNNMNSDSYQKVGGAPACAPAFRRSEAPLATSTPVTRRARRQS